MTNTKWLSALLAGTALSVASTAALADTTFVTMKRNAAAEGVTFAVSPTADMPAPATEVTITGEVRSILSTAKATGADRDTGINNRARIFFNAKSDTSVGTVGAYMRLQDSTGASAEINKYYGYWEFAPNMQFTAGNSDSVSAVIYGADWNSNGGIFAGTGVGLTNPGVDQMNVKLDYGPVKFTVGVEENTSSKQSNTGVSTSDMPGVAASLEFSAGDFGAQVAGRTQSFDSTGANGNGGYMVGGGVGYAAGPLNVSVGLAKGRGLVADYVNGGSDFVTAGLDLTDDEFTAGSILASFSLTESTTLEAWYGMADIKNIGGSTIDPSISGFGAGVFYSPVKQLTLGLGADYGKEDVTNIKVTSVALGAWFKF
jgi:hypothetical protein